MRWISLVAVVAFFGGVGCGKKQKITQTRPCDRVLQGSEPINLDQKEGEMLLPKSVSTVNKADAVTIHITATEIRVGNDKVIAVKNGQVDANAKRDAEFVSTTGVAEDRAVVESIQRSIGAKANDVFTFGRFECLIAHFHANLSAALDEDRTAG